MSKVYSTKNEAKQTRFFSSCESSLTMKENLTKAGPMNSSFSLLVELTPSFSSASER